MAVELIRVTGLKEFRRNLRAMDKNLPKGLRLAGNAAAQIVVDTARPRVPRLTGRAAGSVRASSTQGAARVSGGGARVPWYPWLDFGGRVGRNRSVRRPFLKEGRYIWAAFADRRADVQDRLRDELVKVARGAGIEAD
ncbi:MAG: HK97 gp10 family phage protein [Dehalococcoidia bacterium]